MIADSQLLQGTAVSSAIDGNTGNCPRIHLLYTYFEEDANAQVSATRFEHDLCTAGLFNHALRLAPGFIIVSASRAGARLEIDALVAFCNPSLLPAC